MTGLGKRNWMPMDVRLGFGEIGERKGAGMQIGRGMSEGELKKALCGMAEAPVAQGVLAMLDMRIMEGVMAATDSALSDKETAMWLGETRALVSFKEDLVGWLQQERDA